MTTEQVKLKPRPHQVGDRVRYFKSGKVGTIVETHYPGWVDWRPDDWSGHPDGALRTDPSNLNLVSPNPPSPDAVDAGELAIALASAANAAQDEDGEWTWRDIANAALWYRSLSTDEEVRRLREALGKCATFIAMLKNDGVAQLSEGVHAGLRKGTDAPDAHSLWTAISRSTTTAWSDAIDFALDPFFSMWGGDEALSEALAALQSKDTPSHGG